MSSSDQEDGNTNSDRRVTTPMMERRNDVKAGHEENHGKDEITAQIEKENEDQSVINKNSASLEAEQQVGPTTERRYPERERRATQRYGIHTLRRTHSPDEPTVSEALQSR